MCDRHFGIGADGLIVWKAAGRHFDVRIFNRDGSEAECSGNGLRCLAAYLVGSGRWPEEQVELRTPSGRYTLRRKGERFEADMGTPGLRPQEIPFSAGDSPEAVVNYPLRVGHRTVRITACSTGNPHCCLFVDALDPRRVEELGSALGRHPAFPKQTNVEFVRVLDRNRIEVAFWERGVGRTLASGTGSCGATVACVLNGKTGRHVTVSTEAGDLHVEWRDDGRLWLTATANVVAEGRYLE